MIKKLLFALLFSRIIIAQCSDAGVCSVGAHTELDNEYIGSIGIAYIYGYSGKEDDVVFNSILLSSEVSILKNTSIYASIPFSMQSGPSGDVSGIGDLLFLISQDVYELDDLSVSVQAGAKLATGNDNADNLPQIYQSGLGSNDFLAGVSVNYKKFNFAAAYQLAGERNSNILQLERGDDILFRAGYNFFVIDNVNAVIEVLFINRLQESTIADSVNTGYVEVAESNTSQINLTGKLNYDLNETISVSFFGAIPLKNRPVNIDGLKRAITLSAGLNYKI